MPQDMITDFFLFLFSNLLRLISFILPSWLIWPDFITDIITYIAEVVASFNFILPIQDSFFPAFRFLIWFQSLYFGWKIAVMVINFFRGAKGIEI